MPSNSLKLDKLEPARRARPMLFNEDEWEQIVAARERGVGWTQIQEAAPRYKGVETLKYAFNQWKKRRPRA